MSLFSQAKLPSALVPKRKPIITVQTNSSVTGGGEDGQCAGVPLESIEVSLSAAEKVRRSFRSPSPRKERFPPPSPRKGARLMASAVAAATLSFRNSAERRTHPAPSSEQLENNPSEIQHASTTRLDIGSTPNSDIRLEQRGTKAYVPEPCENHANRCNRSPLRRVPHRMVSMVAAARSSFRNSVERGLPASGSEKFDKSHSGMSGSTRSLEIGSSPGSGIRLGQQGGEGGTPEAFPNGEERCDRKTLPVPSKSSSISTLSGFLALGDGEGGINPFGCYGSAVTCMSESSGSSSESSRPIPPTYIYPRSWPFRLRRSSDSVVSQLRPFAGSSTVEVTNQADLRPVWRDNNNEDSDVEQFPTDTRRRAAERRGSGNEQQKTRGYLRWRRVPGKSILVRSSDFFGDGSCPRKQPSLGELYECQGLDLIECPRRITKISSRVELPELDDDDDSIDDVSRPGKSWDAPDTFVVTLSIPLASKGGGSTKNKPCISLSFYFGMKAKTREILDRITTNKKNEHDGRFKWNRKHGNDDDQALVNAVRLFNTWCREAPDDPEFLGRFKLIPHWKVLDSSGPNNKNSNNSRRSGNIPNWMSRWNGTPVLVKKTGFLYDSRSDSSLDESVMELEISLHSFPWAAKKAFEHLREQVFVRGALTLGFLIEARNESELPEVLLGLAELGYPRADLAVPSTEFFQ